MTQALCQLAEMQAIIDNRVAQASEPVDDVHLARVMSFTISRAAYGEANPRQLADAKRLHFALFGTPEIDLAHFGPRHPSPIVCIDGGKPNQLTTLDADAQAWGY
jgi:hypothetical protein